MKGKIVFSCFGLLVGSLVAVPIFILLSFSDGQANNLIYLLGSVSVIVLPIIGIVCGYIYGGKIPR